MHSTPPRIATSQNDNTKMATTRMACI